MLQMSTVLPGRVQFLLFEKLSGVGKLTTFYLAKIKCGRSSTTLNFSEIKRCQLPHFTQFSKSGYLRHRGLLLRGEAHGEHGVRVRAGPLVRPDLVLDR